jgi:YihY family inner membrane protein
VDSQAHEPRASHPLRDAYGFVRRVLREFFANGCITLAGSVAYNGLLSVIPLFLVAATLFARFVDRNRFIAVAVREIRQVVPADVAEPITDTLRALLEVPHTGGIVGFITLAFFSTLAFRTLQHAFDLIFRHRLDTHPPRPLVASMIVSLLYVLAIGFASLLQTIAIISLDRFPYLAAHVPRWAGAGGFASMIVLLASIYLYLPFGKGSVRTALIGATFAAVAWEAVQYAFLWYMRNVSEVNLIYGSMAAVIVVLVSLELAALIVLLGAQIIAEIEKSWRAGRHWYEAPAP